ncbi:hypothetical protein AMJ83_07235 [candidate division WOR_3 bacterium SM23_42]|uniref:Uncharacterized protein n=1 Tax=candidate division WOR_3 bacterium SM23_42 TaxID=1703779 RepID=A0A0S8FUR3_UNCW3|nr:MAG: hypothetical protein AMJ83_07235 [candidate division WOR_3 bacterium SM23_42]
MVIKSSIAMNTTQYFNFLSIIDTSSFFVVLLIKDVHYVFDIQITLHNLPWDNDVLVTSFQSKEQTSMVD